MEKFPLIDSMIIQVDALADMRGAEKCRTILDLLGKLAALKSGLMKDEEKKDGEGNGRAGA